ncbi:MAG: hypothetical protein GMKNLPBB_01760 [Myxococcota bacterium]|nr:hypothetical protein [Myxococcota bacterium]
MKFVIGLMAAAVLAACGAEPRKVDYSQCDGFQNGSCPHSACILGVYGQQAAIDCSGANCALAACATAGSDCLNKATTQGCTAEAVNPCVSQYNACNNQAKAAK